MQHDLDVYEFSNGATWQHHRWAGGGRGRGPRGAEGYTQHNLDVYVSSKRVTSPVGEEYKEGGAKGATWGGGVGGIIIITIRLKKKPRYDGAHREKRHLH